MLIPDPQDESKLITSKVPLWRAITRTAEENVAQLALKMAYPLNWFWKYTRKLYPIGER